MITWVPVRGRQECQNWRRKCDNGSRDQNDTIAGFEVERGPQTKKHEQTLEAGKDKDSHLQPPEGMKP